MKKTNEPGPAPEAPRQRISSLSETMLRINASLDVATVLRDLDAPLRVDNLPAYVRALGFSSGLMLTDSFQAMPMRHLGKHVGIFFPGG